MSKKKNNGSKKSKDSVLGKSIRKESSNKIKDAKEQVKPSDYIIDMVVYIVSVLWMFFGFFDSSSTIMRYFVVANLFFQVIIKIAMHMSFYNSIIKYHKSKPMRCLAIFIEALFFIGFALLFFVGFVISKENMSDKWTFIDIFKNIDGILILVFGVIIFIIGALDKTCMNFVGIIRKGEDENDS